VDERARARVGEHVLDLGRRQARVDRHEHRPELHRPEEHLHELGAVLAEVRDGVALADASVPQQRRHAIGGVGELSIRERLVSEDDRRAVGGLQAAPGHPGAESVVVHRRGVLCAEGVGWRSRPGGA
jgi:hypothetical protein